MKYLFLLFNLIAIAVIIVAKKGHKRKHPSTIQPFQESLLDAAFDIQEEALMTTPQIVQKYGYPAEVHHVVTEDGYILEIHRIPHGPKTAKNGKVVFLQHGMLASSSCFILGGALNGIGFVLADAGYDVWLGNARGNKYSRNHTTLNPELDPKFWDFSWHEIALYDVPETIDYILKKTKKSELFYIGHSMGTTVCLIMLSEYPEYNDKITAAFFLAPVAYMNHLVSPIPRAIAIWEKPFAQLLDIMGVDEFLPSSKLASLAGDLLCKQNEITVPLCSNVVFLMVGFDAKQLNESLMPIYSGHFPAGGSTKTILHYGQEIVSGYFRQYDEGIIGNLFRYRSFKPPDYDLKDITAPIYLIYSRNDWFSSEVDVLRLDADLENSQLVRVEDPLFNHMDYLIGIRSPELVYNKVLNIMDAYSEDQ